MNLDTLKDTIAKKKYRHEIMDYVWITVGLTFYGSAWALFLLPYKIVSGGVTGISAIILYATGFPMEYTYFILNACLLVVALKILGLKFMMKTIYGIFGLSLMLKLFQQLVTNDDGTVMQILGEGQDFMSLIIGCSLMGTGLALVFLHNGSTGGTDIIAACINKYKPVSLGRLLIAIDVIIIGSCLLNPKFGTTMVDRVHTVVFGLCTMVVQNIMLDYVMNARRESVQFLIFSKKYDELAHILATEMYHGVTLLDAHGWYSKQEMKVICLVARKRESISIFRLIKMVDPDAFVSQSSVIGVYGKGFDEMKVKAKKMEPAKKEQTV